jgi:hypothetical protein
VVRARRGEAGLVHVEVLAVDGTKVHANASQHANRVGIGFKDSRPE